MSNLKIFGENQQGHLIQFSWGPAIVDAGFSKTFEIVSMILYDSTVSIFFSSWLVRTLLRNCGGRNIFSFVGIGPGMMCEMNEVNNG